jgi:hypothetical protein
MKSHVPIAPTDIHGFLGLKCQPLKKASTTTDYLENLMATAKETTNCGWRLESKFCLKIYTTTPIKE